MASWVIYDVTAAAATLPPLLSAAYEAWLDSAEARAARLSTIAAGVVDDFRVATGADYDATGVLEPESIPSYCLRHVQAAVWYYLSLECGYDPSAFQTGWQDAEVYLRSLLVTRRSAGASATASGAVGTPRYSGSAASAARKATGFAGAADSGLPVTTGTATEAELALRARLDAMAANMAAIAALGDAYEVDELRLRLNELVSKMAGL